MSKYQVTYKANNKTYYADLEANSELDIINLFEKISSAELYEIRKYVYESSNTEILKSNMDNKNVFVKAFNENNQMLDIKIPLLKDTVTENLLINHIKNSIKINSKNITSISLKVKK